ARRRLPSCPWRHPLAARRQAPDPAQLRAQRRLRREDLRRRRQHRRRERPRSHRKPRGRDVRPALAARASLSPGCCKCVCLVRGFPLRGRRQEGEIMKRRLVIAVVAVAALATVVVAPAQGGVHRVSAKTCQSGYKLAHFPWGDRCLRQGQYCKKVRNPEYHKYSFQCVNGKLRKQAPVKKGK